jgi:hypothetical protein
MPDAYTAADAANLYRTGSESAAGVYGSAMGLGGVRLALEVPALEAEVGTPIPQLVILSASGACGEGVATLRSTGASAIAFTAPGGTEGAAVTIADGDIVTAQDGGSAAKYVRVLRDGSTDMGAQFRAAMQLSLRKAKNGGIAGRDFTHAERLAGEDLYHAVFLVNDAAVLVSAVSLYLPTLGTQRVSNSAQLGAAGSGTITTTGSFADWPASGYCRITQSGGTLREIVYYSSRTATSLTVPAAGRGLLGTTAAAGAATDTLDAVPGMRIGAEIPNATTRAIQTIANDTTAPAGVTWFSGITAATGITGLTLAVAGLGRGIWIHRQVPAGATASPEVDAAVTLAFTTGGVAYVKTYYDSYALPDDALDLHELWAGEGQMPDFTGSPAATSATLPFTYALTPPGAGTREYWLVTGKQSKYGLRSLERTITRVTIDSAGVDVTPAISSPDDVELAAAPGGEVDVRASYYADRDTSPADTWAVYATLGADPVPGVDSPTLVSMAGPTTGGFAATETGVYGGLWGATKVLTHALGPYDWGADLRVLVRARRSSDSAESGNTTALQHTVGTVAPVYPGRRLMLQGDARALEQWAAELDTTTVVNAPNNVYIRQLPGESQLWSNTTLVWRCVWADAEAARIHIPEAWDLVEDDTAWGAGTGTIEVVTGPPLVIYLNVAGTRRAKIDVTNSTISAAEFVLWDTLTDCPVSDPYAALATETLLQVWDSAMGRHRAYLSVDSSGVLTTACEVWQTKG